MSLRFLFCLFLRGHFDRFYCTNGSSNILLYCYCCNVGGRDSVELLKLSHICITSTVLVNLLNSDV